jgi:hypothetical protein
MTIVHHRIFYGKIGSAERLIEHVQQGNIMARGTGIAIRPRVLSDFQSGRTDRVIMEWEVEDVGELQSFWDEMSAYPEMTETFQEWFKELTELIHYAEVENFQVH